MPSPRGAGSRTVQSAAAGVPVAPPVACVASVVTGMPAVAASRRAPVVVDRHDGAAGPPGGEEPGLGLEVLVHAAVQVEVVLGEVGEAGDVEHHPVHAVERDGVRGDLHGGGVEAAFAHQGQQGVDVGGLRGGEEAGDGLPAGQDLDGADQSCLLPEGLQQGVDEVGGGGLAVGARDAEEGRSGLVLRPAPVDQGGQPAHEAAGFLGQQHRHGDVVARTRAGARRRRPSAPLPLRPPLPGRRSRPRAGWRRAGRRTGRRAGRRGNSGRSR